MSKNSLVTRSMGEPSAIRLLVIWNAAVVVLFVVNTRLSEMAHDGKGLVSSGPVSLK